MGERAKSCGNCRHFEVNDYRDIEGAQLEDAGVLGVAGEGTCLRYPPAPVPSGASATVYLSPLFWRQPVVLDGDYCGEFEPAGGPPC